MFSKAALTSTVLLGKYSLHLVHLFGYIGLTIGLIKGDKKMPMSRDDHLFLKEHVSDTLTWFVFVPLLIIIVLLGIIAFMMWQVVY